MTVGELKAELERYADHSLVLIDVEQVAGLCKLLQRCDTVSYTQAGDDLYRAGEPVTSTTAILLGVMR